LPVSAAGTPIYTFILVALFGSGFIFGCLYCRAVRKKKHSEKEFDGPLIEL